MKQRLRVGVVLPTYRRLANPANIKRAAELSESLGFDSVWVTDHIVVPAASVEAFGPTFFEAVTTMAYVAGITTRVLIGAAILIVPFRHPLLLAKMLASADQLSGGRLIVGAGLGWLEAESELMGLAADEVSGAELDVDHWRIDLDEVAAHPDFPGTEAPRSEAYGLVATTRGEGTPAQ